MTKGVVYLVGAGPGDPELITVRGLACLQQADVVVHDRLVARQLIDRAPRTARRIDVGKAPGNAPWPQSRINALLVAEARRHRRVVRLKGGDPFVFGRGGEECQALAEAGVRFEIVPGVSSAVAAPAYAGIPLTHRHAASAFTVVTGHAADDTEALDWEALSRLGTLVVMMGLAELPTITSRLMALGKPAGTSVAVISRGTTAEQVVVRGTLADIAERASALTSPATIVIGQVASLADQLAWFDAARAEQRHSHRPSDSVGIQVSGVA
jgi:uroporphyrin-III C-methyltransferase